MVLPASNLNAFLTELWFIVMPSCVHDFTTGAFASSERTPLIFNYRDQREHWIEIDGNTQLQRNHWDETKSLLETLVGYEVKTTHNEVFSQEMRLRV